MQYAKILTHSYWWSFVFFLFTTTVHAQQTASVVGKVVDTNNQTPIEYSSVALYTNKDSSLVAGTLTDSKGYFLLKDLPFGDYYLTVQFIGYTTETVKNIALNRTKDKSDLGDISISLNTEMLDAVVVEGVGSDMKHSIDKQIYKADQFLAASGGSAIDVLRNMPAVSVNVDGEILMRGSGGFLLLVDGRPVAADPTDFLSQLPANSIADIEIITSPSAKYDPDGKSGIINVKTIKGKTETAYLQVNALLGAPSIETFGNEKTARRFGGDFTSNIRKGKWDIALGGDYKRNDNTGYRDGIVRTSIDGIQTESPSLGERSYRRESYSGRAAMTYTIDEWNSLSASVYGGKKSEWRTADLLYDKIQTKEGEDTPFARSAYFNKNMRERRGDFFISSLDYQHTFSNKSSFQASALYERTELGGPTDNLNVNPADHSDVYEQHLMEEYNPLDGFRASLNYTIPFANKASLESGYQYRYLKHIGEFSYNERVIGTEDFIQRPEYGGDIDLTRKIHSLFTQYNKTGEKLSYSAGLRLEHTDRLLEEEQGDNYDYKQWDLFPSLNALYKAGNGYEWKAAYSRRIERTKTSMMNPFMARRHSEVLEEGDPELRPEFIDAVEVGFVKSFNKNSLFANAFYRHTANPISRVNSVYNDIILYRTYTNAKASDAYGLEAGLDLNPVKWWKLYFGGTLYQYAVKGNIFDEELKGNSLNYSFNINTHFKVTPTWTTELNFNYLSRTKTVQGEDSHLFAPNLSVRKSVFNNKGAFTLQWANISMGLWDASQQRLTTRGADFYASTNYINEVDKISISFSYKINELGKALKFSKSEFGEKEF